ncbi:transcription termination factor 1 isoform X2 [Eublepharis macularius]|uniref:Transcription termination factor 1 isoform X2 n=1 Tax=Eublepharis macularius TaxID=481883 RepID=A0AA97KDZ1_EUBMA|nr:transcription termination factor 1 isoform X2 [Eublepharis macularius]
MQAMTNMAEESCTDGFQILNSAKKKKKKRKKHRHHVDTGFRSPLSSNNSSIFSWHFDDQTSEKNEPLQKKSKKKARQERSASQLDCSGVATESELNSEAGTGGVSKLKKKKKRKLSPSEQDDGNQLCIPLSPRKDGSRPKADRLGNGDSVDGGTPAKKKRAKAHTAKRDEASEGTAKPTKKRTDAAGSNKHEVAEPSSPGDSQVDLFASSPLSLCKTQQPSLSQAKATIKLAVPEELGSPVTRRKKRKRKKPSGPGDSDATDVGCAVEETVKSVTNHDRIKKKSRAKRLPLEDSNKLPKTPKDAGASSPTDRPASQPFSAEDGEFLESSELAALDLDTATQELEEFIPHVRSLSASAVKQLASRDLVRFKNFKQKGIAVKFGKFSKKENDQLRKNVEAFLQESRIESAEKLLFAHRFPEEKAAIIKLKAEHLFGVRIAEGIPRPWRLVYYRARKMFDPRNYSGRYSNKEKRKLLKYQAMYGNNWKKISELMSRSSHSVALKYSQIKSGPNSGHWSRGETKKLIQAVEEILQAKVKEFGSALEEKDANKALSVVRENLYKGISWTKVEAKVGTRHWRQCKQKWISVVTKKMSAGQTMSWGSQNLQFKINLIERLYEVNAEDANEVDWESLSNVIGDVPPSYVQGRFYKLKAIHVPFWNQKSFPEIIDYLYEVTLPKLKALVKAEEEEDPAEVQSSQVKAQKKVFQFKDIFQDSSDDLIDESSEEEEEEEEEEEMKPESSMGGSESS